MVGKVVQSRAACDLYAESGVRSICLSTPLQPFAAFAAPPSNPPKPPLKRAPGPMIELSGGHLY